MNNDSNDLIFRAVYQMITEADFEELQDLLETDASLRERYLTAINIRETLSERTSESADPMWNVAVPHPTESQSPESQLTGAPAQPDMEQASRRTAASGIKWLMLVAAAMLVGISTYWIGKHSSDPSTVMLSRQPANDDRSAPETNPPEAIASLENLASQDDLSPLYVAKVHNISSDVAWGKDSAQPDFLLRARRGDRLQVKAGLVQLQYFCGAELILRGPCVYVITGEKSGRLERGEVTGKVEGGDFLLTTPSARVLDLGTEFGVSVNRRLATDVHVFDGEVAVDSDSETGSTSLTQGMSARVNQGGAIKRSSPLNSNRFARELPIQIMPTGAETSLVDLLSATSDGRFALTGVIAPDSGRADQGPWLRSNGPGHRTSDDYHRAEWNPFVDGVFIPTQDGEAIVVDSSRNQVDLPTSKGRTWGPIWSRRKLDSASELVSSQDYWGTLTRDVISKRLEECQIGMIGIHSNVGVTFDLNAVRKVFKSPDVFQCIVVNLDNAAGNPRPWAKSQRFSADVRVFVDGTLRADRLDFTREDGESVLSVSLTDDDRFLTLVSSDCGIDGFDHVVLIDPVLLSESSVKP